MGESWKEVGEVGDVGVWEGECGGENREELSKLVK